MSRARRLRKLGRHVGFWLAVAGVLFFFIFPLAWMVLSSLKTQVQNIAYPPLFIFSPTLKNYQNVFVENPYLVYMMNTAIVAVGTTAFSLILGLPAAFGVARFGQRWLGMAILVGRIMPGVAVLIPWFIVFSRVGLIDTYFGLILAHMVQVFPLMVWVMIGFFEEVPQELEDAARVDGCSIMGAFFKVIIPLSRQGIAAASTLGFIFAWNMFMFALVLAGPKTWTLPVAAYSFIGYGEIDWGGLTAASTVITLPILVLTIFLQRFIVSGLTSGALKG
jgi:multiple sugar transport system permease protein